MNVSESPTIAELTKENDGNQPTTPQQCLDPVLFTALSKQPTRDFIISAEQQLHEYLQQPSRKRLVFAKQPNSYRRMLLHKLAEHHGLTHVVVGRDRDEIAVYRKTDEVDGIQTRVAELVPLDLDMEQEGVAQGFTRILIKDRRDDDAGRRRQQQQQQQQQQEQQGRFGSTSIEQRQAEYERTRAEIFQEEHKPGITSNESTYPDAISAQERMP